MEGDHKGYRAGSELFVCFTSRQSSVRLGSKSVLSPGRTEKFRESSSRRLRSNGSKGQSSPMFPNLPYNLTGRKKNGSFETQEPSSPKVTCIGQVRVKSKQNKRFHNVSKVSKSPEREDCMPHRSHHQKWVHLFGFGKEVSFNICEALRSFGAEFNCFVPCGGTASSTSPASKGNSKETTTCGAVFAKWFMVLQEGDEKKAAAAAAEEEVGQRIAEEAVEISRPSIKELSRPSIKELCRLSLSEDERFVDEEVVSVCPPKNALLLMRCRSEPLRMSPLDDERGCQSAPLRMSCTVSDEDEEHVHSEDDETQDGDEDEDEGDGYKTDFEEAEEQPTSCFSPSENLEANGCPEDIEKEILEANGCAEDIEKEILEANGCVEDIEKDILEANGCAEDIEKEILEANGCAEDTEKEILEANGYSEDIEKEILEANWWAEDIEKEIQAVMGVANAVLEDAEAETEANEALRVEVTATGPQPEAEESCETETETQIPTDITETIPNALLLMMSEPKLSLEISKETWVSKEDFARRTPFVVAKMDDDKENEQSRKLCNVAEALSGATANSTRRVVDEKVTPCEASSFVLTRCKSEPLRASVKLVPEACFWKPRNLEIPSFIIRGPMQIGAHHAY